MLEASQLAKVSVAQLSFARALTETRLFFKLLLSTGEDNRWASIWAAFVTCCARYRVKIKPNRHFPRDRQQYRRKSSGLERKRPGRKPKETKAAPLFTVSTGNPKRQKRRGISVKLMALGPTPVYLKISLTGLRLNNIVQFVIRSHSVHNSHLD